MVMPRLGPLEIGAILRNTRHLIPLGPNEGAIKEAEVTKHKCHCKATFDTFAALKSHDDAEHPIVIRPLHYDEMPFFLYRFKCVEPISLVERVAEKSPPTYDGLKAD